MALHIHVTCSNHQTSGPERTESFDVDALDEETGPEIKVALAVRGWVVQVNGDNMDTYCSKKCAE